MNTEGDEWYKRNKNYDKNQFLKYDPICKYIKEIAEHLDNRVSLLEIGCSDGRRLKALRENYDWEYLGIEPSTAAIETGKTHGINIRKGSAESLPVKTNSIDILIYGFCLYLCDREELFSISAEGNRVTKNKSWIIIHDFWSKADMSNKYHHKGGIKSYKTKPEEMFLWHTHYTIMDSSVRDISTGKYTDERNNWVKTSIIRKNSVIE